MRLDDTTRLPQSFCARDVDRVARALVGQLLVRDLGRADEVVLRITEVEAYGAPSGTIDTASHTRAGRTARNAPMWGPAGHAYVYLCYGLHQMLNIVAGAEGEGCAVLVRACEPVAGHVTVQARRGGARRPADLLAGPGKVGAALAIDKSLSGAPLFVSGTLELHRGTPIPRSRMLEGPRVGVEFAAPCDRDALRRFAVAGSEWVSHTRTLAPAARAKRKER